MNRANMSKQITEAPMKKRRSAYSPGKKTRKSGLKGAPTAEAFRQPAKAAKKR